MKNFTIYVDMDDTLCDFAGQAYLDLKANPAIRYPQAVYGFFTKLRPIKNAIESMKELEQLGFDVWILTRPSVLNPLCYTEKRVWVEQHLGLDWCERLILCPDKGRVGTDVDYLIDDMFWEDFKGTQIHFGQIGSKDWEEIMPTFRKL